MNEDVEEGIEWKVVMKKSKKWKKMEGCGGGRGLGGGEGDGGWRQKYG